MRRFILFTAILFLPFAQGCEETPSEKIYKDISGVVQKGPFLNGSSVSIYTLNDKMGQTGETFSTQISDNAGSFSINSIGLTSNYVEIVATGFYYNEVTDKTSGSQLTLRGLADLSDHTTVNVNIITHLTRNRIITLMEEGKTFASAREQALEELFNIFNFESSDVCVAELLDISTNSEDNAMLLAISLIVQGQKRDADLSEFIANLVQDFSVDGTLDSETLKSELINQAAFLDDDAIRENLVNRYDGIGFEAEIPPFETYLEEFADEKPSRVISGVVQKGPFLNGTTVSIYTLNDNMGQTGESFSTQISDNAGSFSINITGLSSNYVEFVATGFYYNEVTDETSGSQLTLLGLADLSDHTTVNVNIITHLTKNRIITLMEEGSTFTSAKEQAREELFNIFNFESSDVRDAELLDISTNSEDNAMLLAISLIVQGKKRDADLSEFMANLVQDFSDDGILDSETLKSELINEAVLLDGDAIRQNLVNRYDGIGLEAEIPPFETYLEEFIDKTDYVVTHHVTYPMFGSNFTNMLYPDSTHLQPQQEYNMTALLPGKTSVKIRLSGAEWSYQAFPNGPVNWAVTKYDRTNKTQEFTSIQDGVDCELILRFSSPYEYWDSINPPYIVNDTVFVEYFENGSELPHMTKTIHIEEEGK